MDSQQAATLAMGAAVSVAILWIALNVREIWRADRQPCICGHRYNRHVSAMDWDSDYGDPQRAQPGYMKPGRCRICMCRHYISGRRAA